MFTAEMPAHYVISVNGGICIRVRTWQGRPQEEEQASTHLWLGNNEWAQAVIPNGSGYCQHTHDTHAIPEQDLAPCCLHARLHIAMVTSQLLCQGRPA